MTKQVHESNWLDVLEPPSRPLLLYDGGCRFCRGAARFVAFVDRDQNLAILPFDDPLSAPYMRRIPDRQIEESWQLIEPDGTRLMRGEGGVALLDHVRLTRPIARLVTVLRLTWAIDLIDRVIYKLKPRLARVVPDAPGPRRPPARSGKRVDEPSPIS